MSANDLKEQGNRLFAARHYDDAIGCYTKAIVSSYALFVCLFVYFLVTNTLFSRKLFGFA